MPALLFPNIVATIGNTPLVRLNRIAADLPASIYVKAEFFNPLASVKDRIGMAMIEAAEREGRIKPDTVIVEPTSGNTGIALAFVCAQRGYKLMLTMPETMSIERRVLLRMLGAEIVLTPGAEGMPGAIRRASELIAQYGEKGFMPQQFENPANPLAHETTTAPEIWEQLEHQVDAVVVGVGSSGTITGLTNYFKKVSPHTEFVLADPQGSILADYINKGVLRTDAGSWLVEGIGEDFIPAIADFSLTHQAYTVSDKESFDAVRDLLKNEGILAGSSTGTLLNAAIRYCREQTEPKRVVTLACDSGNKYLSKMYNDYWLLDQGLTERKQWGDLRDFISRRFEDNAIIYTTPTDTLKAVYGKLKLYDVSQLPVLKGDKVIGIVDESDLLLALYSHKYSLDTSVHEIMTTELTTIPYTAQRDELVEILNAGLVAIIENGHGGFMGLVTRIDFINHLRFEINSLKLEETFA